MKVTLGRNIASLKAQRALGDSSQGLARVFERLASGQRINRASDDDDVPLQHDGRDPENRSRGLLALKAVTGVNKERCFLQPELSQLQGN